MAKTRRPFTFIERLGPSCAIGADDCQFIVLKLVGHGMRWEAVGFIHSDKRALTACLKSHALELSPDGEAAMARQDAKIWRWKRALCTLHNAPRTALLATNNVPPCDSLEAAP